MTMNIVFVDSRVTDHEMLTASLGANTKWVLLNSEEDGILQMQRALAGYSELDSIQVISHGSSGAIYLGSTILNASNLYSYASQLQAIGSSLTESGDILLYGCNVGAEEAGAKFLNELAALTGADVAASDDLTGAKGLGGDSILEVNTGEIDATTLNLNALGTTLAILTGTVGNNTYNGTAGVADTAVIDSTQSATSFSFNGVNWVVTSSAGTDTLVSIESVQLSDTTVELTVAGETRANTYVTNQQTHSAITTLSGGSYVVSWMSSDQDSSGYGIYAQRYDAAGGALGVETRVNTYVTGNQYTPAIAALNSGGYVVTWQSWGQDGSGYGIYAQRYDAAGSALGAETRVNASVTENQDSPAITALSGGGYVVTWQSNLQDGSGYGIYAQRYDAAGAALGAEHRSWQVQSTVVQAEAPFQSSCREQTVSTWRSCRHHHRAHRGYDRHRALRHGQP